jgi:hypothetical protein
MAARQGFSQTLKSIAGASLLALGVALLFANLDEIAASAGSFTGLSAHEALGIVPALGLAALHAAQAYAFDRTGFISGFPQILVSFWPSILIAIGAALLRNAFGRLAKSEVVETSSGERATTES